MNAYVLHGISDITYDETERPIPSASEVLVEVKAAGICGSDIPRIYKTGAYHHPLIPGHEFSGKVVELGEGVDGIWMGKRVGVFPLIPCKECPQCKKMRYEMCQNYSYLGSRTDGGFATCVKVPVWNLVELPEQVSYEQAAMLEPSAVAMHSIGGIGVSKENTVAVCGLGTIGLLIVMFLKSMGCRKILVIGNKEFQKLQATKLGISAEEYCDIRENDPVQWINEKTHNQGVDVFFECVGKNDTVNIALASVTAGGKIMLVGNPTSDMQLEKNLYWKILRKQITLKGTWNSSYTHEKDDDWHKVIETLSEGIVHPEQLITHKFPMKDLKKGFVIMRDKSEEYVKIMGYGDEGL